MKQIILSSFVTLALSGAPQVTAESTSASPGSNGAVYTMDNAADGNNVMIFPRGVDGVLLPASLQPAGGLGTGSGLGSQGAILLSRDGQWLFVCNSGSDEISVFAVTREGLQLKDKVDSQGRRPISLALHNDLLYVLNAGGTVGDQDNIAGFQFAQGQLTALPGSTRALSGGNTGPAEVSFTSDGDVLVVTEKATSIIDTFTVGANGLADQHSMFASPAQTPFGFVAARRNRIFVSNASSSSLSSYDISGQGDVEAIGDPVLNNQKAACWVALSGDGRFAYTANAGSGSISGFHIGPDGAVELLDKDGRTGVTGDGSHPIDMSFSRDSRFLYTLNSGNGTISTFRVAPTGSLEPLPVVSGISTAASGLAAR